MNVNALLPSVNWVWYDNVDKYGYLHFSLCLQLLCSEVEQENEEGFQVRKYFSCKSFFVKILLLIIILTTSLIFSNWCKIHHTWLHVNVRKRTLWAQISQSGPFFKAGGFYFIKWEVGKETLGIHIMSIIFNTGGGEEIQTHGWPRSMVSRSLISILTYFVTVFQ